MYMINALTLILPGLEGNAPPALSAVQAFLISHINTAKCIWWTLFILTMCTVLVVAYRKTRNE